MHNFRHKIKEVILNSETMKSPPPSNTPRGSMCVHVFGGRGIFICGVCPLFCLEKISRDSPIIHVFFLFFFLSFLVNSNGYQLPRSRRYMFHKIKQQWLSITGGGGGGVQVMRNEERSPPPPPRFCGSGGGEREVTD